MAIEIAVYPNDCDAFGHVNQAVYHVFFERARWQVLAEGPGMDVFTREGVWPAVRHAVIDHHAGVWPGDVLRFDMSVIHRGRTSFTTRQLATRARDGQLVAALEAVFVCINDDEQPVPVPDSVLRAFGADGV
ncbi:MAG TPA: thioesterase family protein [Gemmatimonadales bacterium]|jgi:YbgC/YbaW family acyl-CoA thioester hydrolase|nr:thioesterase family protein [Gemmatimonadales bacterium]